MHGLQRAPWSHMGTHLITDVKEDIGHEGNKRNLLELHHTDFWKLCFTTSSRKAVCGRGIMLYRPLRSNWWKPTKGPIK